RRARRHAASGRRGCAAVPRARRAADAGTASGLREAGGSRSQAREPRGGGGGGGGASAAESGAERNGDSDLHSETDGLMAWGRGGRASRYVGAGVLAAGMLVWAAHEAWPSREIPVPLPIVVTSAYDEW